MCSQSERERKKVQGRLTVVTFGVESWLKNSFNIAQKSSRKFTEQIYYWQVHAIIVVTVLVFSFHYSVNNVRVYTSTLFFLFPFLLIRIIEAFQALLGEKINDFPAFTLLWRLAGWLVSLHSKSGLFGRFRSPTRTKRSAARKSLLSNFKCITRAK